VSPAIHLTGLFRDHPTEVVDATEELTAYGLHWLDDVRDNDPELFAVWEDLHPGEEVPHEVHVEDSIVAWFDELTSDVTSALVERRPSVLAQNAASEDASVRRAVAQNPHTPRALLNRLCGDPDLDVACQAAQNPRTSTLGHLALLGRLTGLTAAQVRRSVRALASSPTVSTSALERARPLVSGDLADFLEARLMARSGTA
jgi:hypothetical protein